MAKIDLVEALKSGEIKDARMQGTDVISIKYPGNVLKHFKLRSLVADYEDDQPTKRADSKVEAKKKK